MTALRSTIASDMLAQHEGTAAGLARWVYREWRFCGYPHTEALAATRQGSERIGVSLPESFWLGLGAA